MNNIDDFFLWYAVWYDLDGWIMDMTTKLTTFTTWSAHTEYLLFFFFALLLLFSSVISVVRLFGLWFGFLVFGLVT